MKHFEDENLEKMILMKRLSFRMIELSLELEGYSELVTLKWNFKWFEKFERFENRH